VDEKYGQADFLWGGGMEHQTCTSYGSWNEALFAHEIAHQWWGDMITCESFHHIWLNEGFAEYSEAMWFEDTYSPYTASEYLMDYQLYLGDGTIYVEDPQNENIFELGLSYHKASWVLHMLRHIVGENHFINIMKTYYSSRTRIRDGPG
jgi:aminopeptidase N